MVGETEQSLQQKGVPYVVGRCSYDSSARGRIVGDTHGFLKLIFRRGDMTLLGVHALGEQATEPILSISVWWQCSGVRHQRSSPKLASIPPRSVRCISLRRSTRKERTQKIA